MPKFCSNCGTQVNENSKFCAACGFALAAPASQPYAPQTPSVRQTPPQYQPPLTQANATPPAEPNKRQIKTWIPVAAAVAALLVVLGALWLFTDVLPWTNKGNNTGDLSALSPGRDMIDDNAADTGEGNGDAENSASPGGSSTDSGSSANSANSGDSGDNSTQPSPDTSSSQDTSLPTQGDEQPDGGPAASGDQGYSVDYLIASTPDYILYVEEEGICRIDRDGSNRQVLFDNPTTGYFLDIIDEELYFTVTNYTFYEAPFFVTADLYPVSVYAMDVVSGSVRTVLDSVYNLRYYLGTVYYTPDYIEIWKMDLNPGSRAISILDFGIDWSYCAFEIDIINSSLFVTTCDWDFTGDEPDAGLSISRAHYAFDGTYFEDILPHRKESETVYWEKLENGDIFRIDAGGAASFLYSLYLESGFDANQLVSDSSQNRFYLFEKYIYYWAYETGYYTLHRADHNGLNDVALPMDTFLDSAPLYYHDGYIYMIDDYMATVTRFSMDGSGIASVYNIYRDVYADDWLLCFAGDMMGIYDLNYSNSGFQGLLAVVDLNSVGR